MNESEIEGEMPLQYHAPILRKLERESEHYEEKRSDDGCLLEKDGEAMYRLFEYVALWCVIPE